MAEFLIVKSNKPKTKQHILTENTQRRLTGSQDCKLAVWMLVGFQC